MDELKPCLIDRNKIPFKELWQEASCFADDIVCAVGTDFMPKIAEAERKFICDLLNSLQRMEVVDAVPVVRCRDCKHFMEYTREYAQTTEGADGDCYIKLMNSYDKQYFACTYDDFCSYGERKEGAE